MMWTTIMMYVISQHLDEICVQTDCLNHVVRQLFNRDDWENDELAEDVLLKTRQAEHFKPIRRKSRQACSRGIMYMLIAPSSNL